MEDSKRFYWIKLKTDFFNREDIDFLLSQKNGCEYVVLYQMLCLSVANTNGRLEKQIGEILVPYNVEKITRDCKYFDIDTVRVALELFKQLGLVYEETNQIISISNYDEMIGSETSAAIRKREYREKQKKILLEQVDNVGDNVPQEYRDKSIEYIKEINNNKLLFTKKRKTEQHTSKEFIKPTLEEITNYCNERKNNINPNKFIDYYNSCGWTVGKNKPMKDWKAAIRLWEKNNHKETINPNWVNEEIKSEPMTEEEIKEFSKMFEEFT